jgi:hypothetical protein
MNSPILRNGFVEIDKDGELLAQLPQLKGYFDRNLLILRNPKKKVVTTNYALQTFWVDSI